MGRLDLPDVYRDEDYAPDGSPVDSPPMAREAGDSIVLRATEEPHVCMCVVTDDDWTHWRPCPPSLCERAGHHA